MLKFYIASSIGEAGSTRRKISEKVRKLLEQKGEVYAPWKYKIPNAWDYSNTEWGLMVFTNDVHAIDTCDWVIVISQGRKETTAGTAWEAGYAFAKGKKVLVVELDAELRLENKSYQKPAVQSLMMSNGCFASVRGFNGLRKYDFTAPREVRTVTEQK